MSETFYKATRPDGTDWHTGKTDYLQSPTPPLSGAGDFPGATWYHLATVPSECIGSSWPCRLFEVRPAPGAQVHRDAWRPHRIGCTSVEVIREIDAWQVLGPNGKLVAAFIERLKVLTATEIDTITVTQYAARRSEWYLAYDAVQCAAHAASRDTAWYVARDVAYDVTQYAEWYEARDAARDAASALVVEDLISPEQYEILTRPYATIIRRT